MCLSWLRTEDGERVGLSGHPDVVTRWPWSEKREGSRALECLRRKCVGGGCSAQDTAYPLPAPGEERPRPGQDSKGLYFWHKEGRWAHSLSPRSQGCR